LIASIISLAPALLRADAGHTHAGEPGKAGEITRAIEVVMNDEMRFQPASFAAKRGEVIRFVVKNIGEMPHEFVLGTQKEIKEHYALMQKHPEMEHDDPNAISLEPGKTGEIVWKFTNAGTFQFACLKPGHYEAGMIGNLAVRR
jgi:uncharacterized cupredoxin-like copper-binding protein